MKEAITVLHLPYLKGVLVKQAEITPNEPGQVMLPREAMIAIRYFYSCQTGHLKS
ncbi:hypothetical protein [Croceitalea sp. MTPC5]|uniref:hypothetical protein n=1 Tax=Croceitalea sp. MTPC5 TaxID=3056565 RepID=UPI00403F20BB